MDLKLCFLLFFFMAIAECLPTTYKMNGNRILEPDLVPVSSTVIPISIYKVETGFKVGPNIKLDKIKKPEGPISLITINSKKATKIEKPKDKSDSTVVKQISKKEFEVDDKNN